MQERSDHTRLGSGMLGGPLAMFAPPRALELDAELHAPPPTLALRSPHAPLNLAGCSPSRQPQLRFSFSVMRSSPPQSHTQRTQAWPRAVA